MTDRRDRTYLKSMSELVDRVTPQGFTPPQAEEAERSVLGVAMVDRDSAALVMGEFGTVTAITSPFYRDSHTLIYQAICRILERNATPDMLAVNDELRVTGGLDAVGGTQYLVTLCSSIVTTVYLKGHCKIIREKHQLRTIMRIASEFAMRAAAEEELPLELATQLEAGVSAVMLEGVEASFIPLFEAGFQAVKDMEAIQKNPKPVPGLPTGLHDVDQFVGGSLPGDLIILAARPGQGKSAMANQFARGCSIFPPNVPIAEGSSISERGTTLFFSLEMRASRLARRLLAADADISLTQAKRGWLNDAAWERIGQTQRLYKAAPVEFYDHPGVDIHRIKAEVRHRVTQRKKLRDSTGLIHPVRLVVIDYLGLIDMPEDNANRAITKLTRALKVLALELEIPIVLLSQLNRDLEKRVDKRPMMSDLRDSGAIEQDADMIFFLFRPESYGQEVFSDGTPTKGVAEFIVAKNREGETGTLRVAFDGDHARFSDMPVDMDRAEAAFAATKKQPDQMVMEPERAF